MEDLSEADSSEASSNEKFTLTPEQEKISSEIDRERSLERRLKDGLQNIRDELNGLAMMGVMPMWTSLIGRLDDLQEELFGGE